MQPAIETEPITETRGDDWLWPLALLGDNDVAIDLTGCTFDGAMLSWQGGALPLTTVNGRLLLGAVGELTVSVARADTIDVPDGQRTRAVIPIIDTLGCRSTLLIIPILVIAP
jgi:hypothetical protein